jgi:Uma2 family endonuclease
MSALTSLIEPPSAPLLKRWSRAQYERAVAAGIFGPEERLELIDGVIIYKMPQNPPHMKATQKGRQTLERAFGDGFFVLCQAPVMLSNDGVPEPDLAVILSDVDALDGLATESDVALVVEVSDTTLVFDQTIKAALYAESGIEEYWLVDIGSRTLEVRRSPRAGGYGSLQTLDEADSVSPLAAPDALVRVADLLPRPE